MVVKPSPELKVNMKVSLDRVIIYAKDMQKTADFYTKYFALNAEAEDRLIVLSSPEGHEKILIHQAAKSIKMGQVCVKLVFTVSDVEKFKAEALKKGLKFGATHNGGGYLFSNTKDPSNNNVSISSRGLE